MTPTDQHITDLPATAPFGMARLEAIAQRLSLRAALRLDALVTGANGAAYLIAAEPLADLLGLSPVLLRVLGAVLIVFAALVAVTAARPAVPRPAVLSIIAVNAAWAVAGIGVACMGWTSPTTVGAIWIVTQALVVAGFAELQATSWRRYCRSR